MRKTKRASLPGPGSAELTRLFWAAMLSAEIKPDGQVPGFRRFWDGLDPDQRKLATRYEQATLAKVQRDGRDPAECAQAGAQALKSALRQFVPRHSQPATPAEVAELFSSLSESLAWHSAKPRFDPSDPVPRDQGDWLRANGPRLDLWPPNFLHPDCLRWIGWPWPEWPKSLHTLQSPTHHLPKIPPADETFFQPTTPPPKPHQAKGIAPPSP